MAVVRKGKISLVHAVASNRTRWKRQCEWWTSRSLPHSWLCRQYWESFLSTVVSFGGGLLWSFEIWKNRSAPSKHTGVSDVFSRFWNFWKITNEGSHSKTDVLTDFSLLCKQFSVSFRDWQEGPLHFFFVKHASAIFFLVNRDFNFSLFVNRD